MIGQRGPWPVLLAAIGLLALAGVVLWWPTARSGSPVVLASPALQITPPTGPPSSPPQGITVSGEGEAQTEPDVAIVNLGVTHIAPTASEAMRTVSERLGAVISTIKSHGVEDKDVQTSGLSLQPIQRPRPPADGRPPEIEAYRASNNVTVSIRDINRASAILDAATSNGANVAGALRFAASNAADLKTQALSRAVRNATRNAEAVASAAGVRITGVASISEEGVSVPVPRAAGVEALALRAAEAPPPVEPGGLTVRARVRATYLIGPGT